MPKKAKNVNDFSGGLNNNTTPRDLGDNEFQVLLNLSNEVPGKLKVIGDETNVTTSALNAINSINYGNGLLHYNSDRNLSSPTDITETEYILINDITATEIKILDCNSNGHVVESDAIDYGNTAAKVEMNHIDGVIRVVPHFGSSVGTNVPKSFGYYKFVRRLGGGDVSIDHEDTGDMYSTNSWVKPLQGTSSHSTFVPEPDVLYNSYVDETYFYPDHGSEVYMPPITIDNDNQYNTGFSTLEQVLDNWDTYTGLADGYTDSDQGSMAFIPYFQNNTTDESSSNILVNSEARYGFFCSKVYKDFNGLEQESVSVYLGIAPQNASSDNIKQKLYFGLVGRMGDRANNYSGFKIYWAKIDNYIVADGTHTDIDSGVIGPKYLFCEVDFEEGIRLGGSKSFNKFTTDAINSETQFVYPGGFWQSSDAHGIGEVVTELSTAEPSLVDFKPVIGQVNTGYKTSTMLNRRLYVGNVQYYNQKNELVTKSDRILKSKVNQFDFFEEESFIDAAVEDGDSIIRLAGTGSKLLQFKKRNLYVINVSRNIEVLESTLSFKGVEKDYHVLEGEGFIAWFNKYGVYLYDGNRVIDIHLNQKKQPVFDDWGANYYHDNNVIGFMPKTKQIFITNNQSSNNVLIFDIKSQSWITGDVTSTNDMTNIITRNNGDINWVENQSNDAKLVKWVNTSVSFTKTGVIMQSKEFDFGTPMINKNINTAYVNCKETANMTLQGFGTKIDGSPVALTDIGALSNTTSSLKTLKLAVPATFKNLSSFGIALKSSGAVDADFEVNDIQIVYREKTLR